MGRFDKALPNVKIPYVTLKDFTPDLHKIYRDISAISVTLCNSAVILVIIVIIVTKVYIYDQIKSNLPIHPDHLILL